MEHFKCSRWKHNHRGPVLDKVQNIFFSFAICITPNETYCAVYCYSIWQHLCMGIMQTRGAVDECLLNICVMSSSEPKLHGSVLMLALFSPKQHRPAPAEWRQQKLMTLLWHPVWEPHTHTYWHTHTMVYAHMHILCCFTSRPICPICPICPMGSRYMVSPFIGGGGHSRSY